MDYELIGQRIRAHRKLKGLTQQELAERCLFSGPWTISRLETRGTDSLGALEVVCKALEIEVVEILKDEKWSVERSVMQDKNNRTDEMASSLFI